MIRPTGVTADTKQRLLIIQWQDGHESRLPFAGLRAVCPCVVCKGGHAHMGTPPDLRLVREAHDDNLTIKGVHAVGSYALQINWSDGHNTGIYTWEYLRQADPALNSPDG